MPTTLAPPQPCVPFARDLAQHGTRPALLTAEGTLTYAELAARVAAAAATLGSERRLVLVAAANAVEPVVLYLAALSAGHPVLLAPGDNAQAVDALIRAYDPDTLYARGPDGWTLEHRHAPAHDLHPDLAVLLTTSGSTGSPKLVRLSHDNLQSNADAIAEALAIRPDDRAATTLPIHYCYGLSVLHSHLLRGAGIVLTDLSVVDRCFWELFTTAGGTTLPGVPYTFDLLDRIGFADVAPPTLRCVTQAGGRLAPERVRQYAELGQRQGWDLVVMYGQTEATARMAYLPPDLARSAPGSVGRPVPGGSLDVSADGELVYRGPNVMLGYAETPADLALGRTVDELRTGDLARRRPDGLFELVGRRSRFAKVLGQRLDLDHLERTLGACCVELDGRLGLLAEGPVDLSALRRLAARATGLPARMVRVRAVDTLPRLASGKPDLPAVTALLRMDPQPETVATDLRALYAEVLDRPDAGEDDTFVSLGGDSLSYVEMSVRLEQTLGHLPPEWHTRPIGDLRPRSRRATLETGIALRAAAILLIVGTHSNVFDLSGGAHVLLAIAGWNLARFALARTDRRERLRGLAAAAARVVAPSVAFIAVAALVTDRYGAANVALVNSVVTSGWSATWHFWFVEALVHLLLGVGLLLAVPAVHRLEQRRPLALAAGVLAAGLALRYALDDPNSIHTAGGVLWLFALGWAGARATATWQRMALTGVLAASMYGYFTDARRGAFVVVGVALLLWLPALPCPRWLSRVAAVLAGGSLYVYLTHWVVYPHLEERAPVLAVAASLAVGLAYWRLWDRLMARITAAISGRRDRPLLRVP